MNTVPRKFQDPPQEVRIWTVNDAAMLELCGSRPLADSLHTNRLHCIVAIGKLHQAAQDSAGNQVHYSSWPSQLCIEYNCLQVHGKIYYIDTEKIEDKEALQELSQHWESPVDAAQHAQPVSEQRPNA